MTKTNMREIIRTLIIALISLSVVIYFIIICVNGLEREYIEDGWIATPGTILSQDIELKGKENIQRKTRGIEQVLNYKYEVAGRTYRSNSVAREVYVPLEKYPEGRVVDIYYNPKRPYDSVLVRTKVPKLSLYGMIGACSLIICVILYFCVRDLKALKS